MIYLLLESCSEVFTPLYWCFFKIMHLFVWLLKDSFGFSVWLWCCTTFLWSPKVCFDFHLSRLDFLKHLEWLFINFQTGSLHTHMARSVCSSQRITFTRQFSPSSLWVPETKLRSSGLVITSTFPPLYWLYVTAHWFNLIKVDLF